MANAISVFKEDASKSIERLATEIETFFLLASFLLALDSFLCRFSHRNLSGLSFDWSVAQGVNIGSTLLFLTSFSFIITVVSPLMIWSLRELYCLVLKLDWWDKLFSLGEGSPGRPLYNHVLLRELENHALSADHKFYLMDLVEKQEKAIACSENKASKLAYLSFSFLVNAGLNAFLGFSARDTLWWKLLFIHRFTNYYAQSAIGWLGLGFCIIIAAALKPLFMYGHRNNQYVYYPPLAQEQRREREKKRENRPAEFYAEKT